MKQILLAFILFLAIAIQTYAQTDIYTSEKRIKVVKNDIKELFLKKNFNLLPEKIYGETIQDLLSYNMPEIPMQNNMIMKKELIKHFNKIFSKAMITAIIKAKVSYFDRGEGIYVLSIDSSIVHPEGNDELEGGYNFYFQLINAKYTLVGVSING